jgi:hypothetical protein
MVIGLVGLAAMAIPAFGHTHGALSGHSAHGISHAVHGAPHGVHGVPRGMPHASAPSARGALQQMIPADAGRDSRFHWLPSPRALFSVLALYGAFGNACVHALHLSATSAALAAFAPALLVEALLVRPLWNVLFRVQAAECSPLAHLVLSEARAVVPFRNGRGLVSTVRDGRHVQLAAGLREDQRTFPVKVGDRLLIEQVDVATERVTVSVYPS